MSKVAIVYWSGTGNTESMANSVLKGAKEKGGNAVLLNCTEFDSSMMDNFDAVAFGCPSMGVEELEENEFAPMFASCEPKLKNKKIALFGSYGWGDGEWMRNWEDACASDGAVFACGSVICNEAPDDEASAECEKLGAALV